MCLTRERPEFERALAGRTAENVPTALLPTMAILRCLGAGILLLLAGGGARVFALRAARVVANAAAEKGGGGGSVVKVRVPALGGAQ